MKLTNNYLKASAAWGTEDTVIGFNGKIIPKKTAILIGDKFYEKGVSATLIFGIWYKITDPNLVKDAYNGEMGLKSHMLHVIIDTRMNKGFVSHDCPIALCKPLPEGSGNSFNVMSPELAIALGYEECLNSGIFFTKGIRSPYYDHKIGAKFFNNTKELKKRPNVLPANIPFNTKYGLASHTFIKSENKKYTFGVEMETSAGVLEPYTYKDKLNLSAVRDGSITGGEFVTGILTGDQGLLHLRKICKELVKRCDVDERCGIHVHVGGFIPNKEFTIYAFVLGHLIQDELFAMLPSSRRSGEYSRPFEGDNSNLRTVIRLLAGTVNEPKIGYQSKIDEAYEVIFTWLSNGEKPSDVYNKTTAHPHGRYCGGHASARYKWLNLVCTNFSKARFDDSHGADKEPSWTIEFRNHSATLSYRKIEAWILICFAFVWFVEHRKNVLLDVVSGKVSICLKDILVAAYPKSHPTLIQYVIDRTHLFSRGDSKADYKLEIQKEPELGTLEFLKEHFHKPNETVKADLELS